MILSGNVSKNKKNLLKKLLNSSQTF